MATPAFADVKTIFDNLIAAWKTKHGRAPHLAIHGPDFSWETRDKLAAATAFDKQLIDPALAAAGKATETNLYIALTAGFDDESIPRMPPGGPFISDADLATLVTWINANMPG